MDTLNQTQTLRIATFNCATGLFVEHSPDGYRFNYRTANEAGAHGCIVAGSVDLLGHSSLNSLAPVGRCRRIIVSPSYASAAQTTGGAP